MLLMPEAERRWRRDDGTIRRRHDLKKRARSALQAVDEKREKRVAAVVPGQHH
ncbi:hypothetical protein [Azovibrio sp.]|uniref:hypothetical protein n=1 Tax=Azovibrio sp. TaxID=1872673 RepID=UPI003C70CA1C